MAEEKKVAKAFNPDDLSPLRRKILLYTGIYVMVFSSGLAFGWLSFSIILTREGHFEDECTEKELDEDGQCDSQQEIFAQIYGLAHPLLWVGEFVGGLILDRYGQKQASAFGVVNIFIGLLLSALSPKSNFFFLLAAQFFTNLGASPVLMGTIPIAFTTRKPETFLSLFEGLLTFSLITVAMMEIIHRNSDLSLRTICLSYLVVLAISLVMIMFLYPNGKYQFQDTESESDEELEEVDNTKAIAAEKVKEKHEQNGTTEENEPVKKEEHHHHDHHKVPHHHYHGEIHSHAEYYPKSSSKIQVNTDIKEVKIEEVEVVATEKDEYDSLNEEFTVRKLFKMKAFIYGYGVYGLLNSTTLTLWISVMNPTMESYGDENSRYASIIGVMTSCTFIFSPSVGYITRNYGLYPSAMVGVVAQIVTQLSTAVPIPEWQFVSVIFYLIARLWNMSLLFNVCFVLSEKNLGKIHGIGMLVIALAMFVLNPLMIIMAYQWLDADWTLVHIICAVMQCFGFFFPRTLKPLDEKSRKAADEAALAN